MNAKQRRSRRRRVLAIVKWQRAWAEANPDPWMDEPWTAEELECLADPGKGEAVKALDAKVKGR